MRHVMVLKCLHVWLWFHFPSVNNECTTSPSIMIHYELIRINIVTFCHVCVRILTYIRPITCYCLEDNFIEEHIKLLWTRQTVGESNDHSKTCTSLSNKQKSSTMLVLLIFTLACTCRANTKNRRITNRENKTMVSTLYSI